MRRKTPGPIWTKFCTEGDIRNVITTDAHFGDDRLRRFSMAMGQILDFSIGFRRRPYNTLDYRLLEEILWYKTSKFSGT